jgi:hypothetical protein
LLIHTVEHQTAQVSIRSLEPKSELYSDAEYFLQPLELGWLMPSKSATGALHFLLVLVVGAARPKVKQIVTLLFIKFDICLEKR